MKLGMIVRAEDRGLGHMTWEMARALRPDRVLIVAMGRSGGGFAMHPARYTDLGIDTCVVPYPEMGGHSHEIMRFLRGLDVCYSAETFYDWRFCERASDLGVRTVCHVMPEFWNHWRPDFEQPSPDVWWAPTPWMLERLPEGTPVVPVPVPMDRWPEPVTLPADGPLRVLHVAGHRAMADRNGTLQLFNALRHVNEAMHVHVVGQDGRMPHPSVSKSVRYSVNVRGVRDYWRMYDGHDVLVLPRRYGGLCLPVQQAAGAGLGIVMPDVEPNAWYPTERVPCTVTDHINCALGHIPIVSTDPVALAGLLDDLARDPQRVAAMQARSRRWAEANSWERLAGLYRARLEEACMP